MAKIDTSNWKEFKLTDLGFANYHGIRQTKATREDGDVPLLTAGKENQGVASYISNAPSTYKDAITVDMFGNSFFHKGVYTGDDNIYFFVNDKITDYAKLFITSVLNTENTRKYAFKEQFRQPQADALTVTLPTTVDGCPDWSYMETYMQKAIKESEESLEGLRRADQSRTAVYTDQWKEFRVGDLFEKLELKCKLQNFNKAFDVSSEKTEEFNLPLTNACHYNNGIQFYGRETDWDSAEMTIDIISNGAIATGDVYAQPQKTGVLWDSYLIKCKYKIESELVLHYIACVMEKCVKQFFSWSDKCTWEKVREKDIKLPITATGSPDFAYMKSYMEEVIRDSEQCLTCLSKVTCV